MANIKGITIEIDGSTTKLQKALGDVNKRSRDLSKELTAINRELRFNPGNSELIAQKQRVLAESVENTEKKLKSLKDAHKQASEQLERGEIGQDEFDALSREIIKAESQLKYYNAEMKKIDPSIVDKVAKGFETAGQKTKAAGEKLTKGLTVPIVGIGTAAMLAFNEVDKGLDTIVKKTGATGEVMDKLEESFINVFTSLPYDSQEVGDAIGEVNTQFGFMDEALESATTRMIKFSEITDADITNSTISAKKSMEMYNLEMEKLPDVLDAVAFESQRTGVSTDKLFDVVIKGAPQLKAMGLGFEESVHLMATFEQKGIDSSKALSYMTRAQTTWAKEGKSLNEGLKELSANLETATTHEERVALAAEAFGTKGGAYMLEALDQLGISLEDFTIANIDASGTVESTWDEIQDPIDRAKVAFNNAKVAGKELGEAIQETMAPMMERGIDKLKDLVAWFKNLSPETKENIVKFGLFAAAIGPVLVVLGTFLSAISKIIGFIKLFGGVLTAVSAGPVGIIIAAIAGIILILAALKLDFGAVADWIRDKAAAIGGFFVNLKDKAVGAFWEIVGGAQELAQSVPEAIKGAINDALAWIEGKWEDFKNAGANIVSGIAEGINGAIEWVKDAASNVASKIRGFFPFSPAKEGPLKSINRLNFGGPISESILRGRSQIESALNKALSMEDLEANFAWTGRPDQLRHAQSMPTGKGTQMTNHITINNPVPEKASDSVRKTLLKQSYNMA